MRRLTLRATRYTQETLEQNTAAIFFLFWVKHATPRWFLFTRAYHFSLPYSHTPQGAAGVGYTGGKTATPLVFTHLLFSSLSNRVGGP